MKINFDVSPEEKAIIDQIVERAGRIWPEWDGVDIAMDIAAPLSAHSSLG